MAVVGVTRRESDGQKLYNKQCDQLKNELSELCGQYTKFYKHM